MSEAESIINVRMFIHEQAERVQLNDAILTLLVVAITRLVEAV